MENSGTLTVPYRSSYLQYKHNTSILIRWIVTTASSCAPDHAIPKPKNGSSKNKKAAAKGRAADSKLSSPEVTLTGLVSLSGIIAEAHQAVPNAILSLFDKVIQARTTAWECFEQLWADNPDEDLKRSNESHRAFIDALQSARNILGSEEKCNDGPSHTKSHASKTTNSSSPGKDEAAGPLEFVNQFAKLDIEDLPSEDEVELEAMASGTKPPMGSDVPPENIAAGKGRSKGKKRKVVPESLASYKITSETEIYFAVCFFIKDLLELRRYTFKLWKDVGRGVIKPVVAGALSNLAIGLLKTAQYDLGMDYPECLHYRGIANHLVRNGNLEIIGGASKSEKPKFNQLIQGRARGMRQAEEILLLNCHDDLVAFITEYRKKRNGRPGPMLKCLNWNPNFISTEAERSMFTPERLRKWNADYTMSWLYDLVNTYAAARINEVDKSTALKDAEVLDWSYEGLLPSAKKPWSNRQLWGLLEFAQDITVLAMQKPGSPILSEIKPHHVFQLQLVIDSMRQAKRWHTDPAKLPPIDLFGTTHSTLPWEFSSDVKETKAIRDRYTTSASDLVLVFEKDQNLPDSPTPQWELLIYLLTNLNGDAECCGEGILATENIHYDNRPKSLFSKSTNNGLWLFSPYLCGTAQVEFFNMSYEWGTRIWDKSALVVSFFHLYNMLLECGHVKKRIDFFERVIELFKDDIFKGGRPVLGGTIGRKNGNFTNAYSIGLGTKATFSANLDSKRRVKGGGTKAMTEGFLRQLHKQLDFTRFKNASKLYALGEAKFMKECIDTRMFPCLREKAPRSATAFLDAVKPDLDSEFDGKPSAAVLNYNGILEVIVLLLNAIDLSVQDLAVEDRETTKAHCQAKGAYGLHDKVFALAFSEWESMMQDTTGKKIDTPLLRKMGRTLEKEWKSVESEVMKTAVLNDFSRAPTSKEVATRNGSSTDAYPSKKDPTRFDETLAEIKNLDPVVYEMLRARLMTMETGDCANCPDCQAGVKLDAHQQLKDYLIKKNKGRGK